LNDKLTYDDYKNATIPGLYNATTFYASVVLNRNVYDNLALNMDAINPKYKDIVRELTALHTGNKKTVDDFNEVTKNLINNNNLERSNKFDWYSVQVPLHENEGMINYMLTNNLYKNKVQHFGMLGLGNHLRHTLTYRTKAVNIYQKLAGLIDQPTSHKSFTVDSVMIKNYLGSFEDAQNPDEKMDLYIKNGRSYGTSTSDPRPDEVIFLSKSKFIQLSNNGFGSIGGDGEKLWIRPNHLTQEFPRFNLVRIKDSTSTQ
jgi:hypothetical protein